MKINITKHTGLDEAKRALETTVDSSFVSHCSLNDIYTWMHSPIRTQIFEVRLEDIPTFVSVHLARHVTTVPFVKSMRIDRGGTGKEGRDTPVDMIIWANAESIVSMATKRLCYKASPETRDLLLAIKGTMMDIDPDLARHMVPQCIWRGGYCCEPRPCGNYKVKRYDPVKILNECL